MTANGNLIATGCGNILDKRNKNIKKSKIKIDPVSTFTDCVGGTCNVHCKPGMIFDKGSQNPQNGVIKVTCTKKGFAPKGQKAKCRKAPGQRSEDELMFDDAPENNNDKTRCLNTIYEKFNTSSSVVDVNCKNGRCTVNCRATGEQARHQWPDGKTTKFGVYVCKGFRNWAPNKGSILC